MPKSHGRGPFEPVVQLIPGVQSYDWGKIASDGSRVATYAKATKEMDFVQQPDKPYAEVSERQSLAMGCSRRVLVVVDGNPLHTSKSGCSPVQ